MPAAGEAARDMREKRESRAVGDGWNVNNSSRASRAFSASLAGFRFQFFTFHA
jgi:hypothetical protein